MILPLDISALPEQLRTAVADIVGRRGPERPLSLADLRELEAAGDQLRRAYHEGEGEDAGPADAHLDAAIGVPGAVLHRPTYGARIALLRADSLPIPPAWAEHPAEWVNLLAAFVLAHAYEPDVLAALATPDQAQAVVETWGIKLPATMAEVAEAVRKLTAGAYPPVAAPEKKKSRGPRPSPTSCASLCRSLAAPPATGSGTSLSPTSAGCCARSTEYSAPAPNPPATAPPPPSPPRTPASRASVAGETSTTDSSPPATGHRPLTAPQ